MSVLQKHFGHLLVGPLLGRSRSPTLNQVCEGLSGRYTKKVREEGLDKKIEDTMVVTGKIGFVACGIVSGIVSYL